VRAGMGEGSPQAQITTPEKALWSSYPLPLRSPYPYAFQALSILPRDFRGLGRGDVPSAPLRKAGRPGPPEMRARRGLQCLSLEISLHFNPKTEKLS